MTAYKHLTERRAKDRKIMADSIATLARSLGASADIVEFGPRSIMVEIETPQGLNVGVEFDGDTPQTRPDTYVIPWNMRGEMNMQHLTNDERERIAYANGETQIANLILETEQDAYDNYVSPELEGMTDDRNRLRDALQECTDRMSDAIDQLEALDPDRKFPDLEFAPAFHDALGAAAQALEQCDAQLDDTLADKLRKAETERDNAQSRLRETDADGAKWRNLRDTVNYLLSPYTGTRYGRQTGKATKPAPKWAQHLIGTLARLEKQ
jgi:hypothetical protein